jgi:hypothetical protein
MQTIAPSQVEPSELAGMLATLCSYENWFGPYHPNTLRLMTEVGVAHWENGDIQPARCLLECAIQDLGRWLGRAHETRVRALGVLRDLLLQQRAHEQACAAQKEYLECQILRLGSDHPETLSARAELAAMLMEAAVSHGGREALT